MAITQTGSTLQFGISGGGGEANSGTVSTTITVPGDAEIVIAAVSAYNNVSGYFSGGSLLFTKSSSQTAMTMVTGADSSDQWCSTMGYLLAPDTGANKTLSFDWLGSGTAVDNTRNYSVTFWKGIDTGSPVRDSDGAQAANFPVTTPTLTCVSGDLIVAFCGIYRGAGDGAGSVDSWTNLTELGEITHESYAEGTWATGSPSGNTTVTAATGTGAEPALSALVLKATAGGTTLDATTAGSYALSGSAATGKFTLTALQAGA